MTMKTTYTETVERYRILRHEELPEAHKAEYRLRGIDPDDLWGLIWSFKDEQAAKTQLEHELRMAAKWQTYKLVDAGAATTIERPIY
jgi:hypothetical protein